MTADEITADKQELAAGAPAEYLTAFGQALDTAIGGLDWPHFLEKPWQYETEWAVWKSLDYPKPGDPDWQTFADAVNL